MQVYSAIFERITAPLPTNWVMRVVIHGTGLTQRAITMVAAIGPQAVQGLMPSTESNTVLGFLTAEPTAGDELLIGYANEPLIATGLTYSGTPNT
ncbi:MAG: hypothetical protein ACRDRX_06440 [Pseudonocardiaceae bacterium]